MAREYPKLTEKPSAGGRVNSAVTFSGESTTGLGRLNARLSDLKKIVQRQNQGKITQIYTIELREQFLNDLKMLKSDFGIIQ
jgi:hypothetical protein